VDEKVPCRMEAGGAHELFEEMHHRDATRGWSRSW